MIIITCFYYLDIFFFLYSSHPLIRPLPQKDTPLIKPLPQKDTPLIRPLIKPNLRYTEIAK
jgi:hypothetical protein